MALKEQDIVEELLSIQATAELTLQRIEKLRKKLNGKPTSKNKPLSQQHIANVLAKRNRIRIKKTIP